MTCTVFTTVTPRFRKAETIAEAIQLATADVYMPKSDVTEAVEALERGEAYEYQYGHCTVELTPNGEMT